MADLHRVIRQGAARRLRPKFMTVATMFLGLAPVMWAGGTGSDVMKRIAAPMIGGILTSFVLELVVYPAVYEMWRGRGMQLFRLESVVMGRVQRREIRQVGWKIIDRED